MTVLAAPDQLCLPQWPVARTQSGEVSVAEALPELKSRLITAQEGGHRLCLRAGELRLRNDQLSLTAADSDTKLIRHDNLACAAVVSLIDSVSG